MFVDFDRVFNQKKDWKNIKLTDNPPCKNCEHKINLRKLHPKTYDSPLECQHCAKRLDYILLCIEKLAWYERKEDSK